VPKTQVKAFQCSLLTVLISCPLIVAVNYLGVRVFWG